MFKIILNGESFELEQKTPILDLIKGDKKQYVAALVNNRLRELSYELSFDSEVKLLDLKSGADAIKVYETSLRYLLAMAFHNIYPEYEIRISYSISRSLYVSIIEPNGININNRMISNIRNEMERIVKEDISFERVYMTKEEAKEYYASHNELDKLAILQYRPEKTCHFSKCGDYLNYMFGYMVPSTGFIDKYNMFAYEKGMIVQYPRYETKGEIPEFLDQPVFSKVLKNSHKWARICNAEVVSKMNAHVNESTYVDFINMNETRHNDMLHELGQIIADDIDNIRLICIAGPSSSGKTTFSNRLRIELMARGIHPLRISLDMYYKKREDCPLDEDGKPDFEDIESLNLHQFNQDLVSLINGEVVHLPYFDFETGSIKHDEKGISISENTPIIIEGIHALNNKLSYAIPKHQKFKIFIAPQFQINLDNHNPISYTDVRLLRRIVRDKKYRGTSAEKTLAMWPSVRRGEFKWIYPFQEECNYIYDSALTYEICVLKKYALPALAEVLPDSPYYVVANRLIKFLKYFNEMDEKWVPCNSLLREFIGGSCFADVEE